MTRQILAKFRIDGVDGALADCAISGFLDWTEAYGEPRVPRRSFHCMTAKLAGVVDNDFTRFAAQHSEDRVSANHLRRRTLGKSHPPQCFAYRPNAWISEGDHVPDNSAAFDVNNDRQPRSAQDHFECRANDVNIEPSVINYHTLHDEIGEQRLAGT